MIYLASTDVLDYYYDIKTKLFVCFEPSDLYSRGYFENGIFNESTEINYYKRESELSKEYYNYIHLTAKDWIYGSSLKIIENILLSKIIENI